MDLVTIGGLGGSGTRLFAKILSRMGYDIGSDLNNELDNLWFTFLFVRNDLWPPSAHEDEIEDLYSIFLNAIRGENSLSSAQLALIDGICKERFPFSHAWMVDRYRSLIQSPSVPFLNKQMVAWKEPNTHIFIEQLLKRSPDLKYIHVMRNGFDMAYSKNQNQPLLWGEKVLNTQFEKVSARLSLNYWCASHARINELRAGQFSNQILIVNYDEFCLDSDTHLNYLTEFLGTTINQQFRDEIRGLVHPPQSIGRGYKNQLQEFDADDVNFVCGLGYPRAIAL